MKVTLQPVGTLFIWPSHWLYWLKFSWCYRNIPKQVYSEVDQKLWLIYTLQLPLAKYYPFSGKWIMLDEITVKNVSGQKMPFHSFWSHFVPTFAESGESKCYIFVACFRQRGNSKYVNTLCKRCRWPYCRSVWQITRCVNFDISFRH
jgi:hypothetical protein